MFKKQKGKCAICRNLQGKNKRRMDIDHDHKTGKIRELLCNSCNKAIGYFKENTTVLESAIIYLKKHKNDKNIKN